MRHGQYGLHSSIAQPNRHKLGASRFRRPFPSCIALPGGLSRHCRQPKLTDYRGIGIEDRLSNKSTRVQEIVHGKLTRLPQDEGRSRDCLRVSLIDNTPIVGDEVTCCEHFYEITLMVVRDMQGNPFTDTPFFEFLESLLRQGIDLLLYHCVNYVLKSRMPAQAKASRPGGMERPLVAPSRHLCVLSWTYGRRNLGAAGNVGWGWVFWKGVAVQTSRITGSFSASRNELAPSGFSTSATLGNEHWANRRTSNNRRAGP
jgi:hypothetical protein